MYVVLLMVKLNVELYICNTMVGVKEKRIRKKERKKKIKSCGY